MKEKEINSHLLSWYKKNKRQLPWRKLESNNLPNPYYTLVSEFMLQQTTVPTVIKRFEAFILNWPTIEDFSKISENTILKFWSGLGYYSRAINLLKTAKIIQKNFQGVVPENYDELISLPGIGDYTAKAIIGIAYNKPVMPLDSNIERIISRIYAFKLPIIKIKDKLRLKSEKFISKNSSTNLIQALMDYGSIVCTPRNPDCANCKIQLQCLALKQNLQSLIPVKLNTQSKKKNKYTRAYIFLNEKNEILIRRRSSGGMLPSMLEVPNDEWQFIKKKLVHDKLVKNFKKNLKCKGYVEYSFSHFKLQTKVYLKIIEKNHFPKSQWIKKEKIENSGLPTVMKKIVKVAI